VNLSCGNCKAIRSFSGEPLKCDVCGWVSGGLAESTGTGAWYPRPSPWYEQIGRTLGSLFVLGIVVVIIAVIITWFTPEAEQLAGQYHVSKDKVVIQPKPHGCDFDDAPLGNKHCHYEKSMDVERDCPSSDCRVLAVYVSWRKVEE
jgi:hypothetical protein